MLIGEGQDWLEGEEKAWETLSRLETDDVCRRARADFNELAGSYILPMFNDKVFISPKKREIWGDSRVAGLVLNELRHYSRLSVLRYLTGAKDFPLSGNLMNPREVSGGLIFAQGSHTLPLDKMSEKYGNDINRFLQRGITLGGEQLDYADSSIRLFPFPRVPVVLLLWRGDGEFPARVDILFDSTCSSHLPTDIIWSTSMMSISVMLK